MPVCLVERGGSLRLVQICFSRLVLSSVSIYTADPSLPLRVPTRSDLANLGTWLSFCFIATSAERGSGR